MTKRDYLNPDDDVMFCLTIVKGTLKAGTQILRYMRIVKEDIRHMIESLENAMLRLKEMYYESCRMAGVSPEDVPEVKDMLEELEEEAIETEEVSDVVVEHDDDDDDDEEPLEFDPDIPDDGDWDDDDDDSDGNRGVVYGGHDN